MKLFLVKKNICYTARNGCLVQTVQGGGKHSGDRGDGGDYGGGGDGG